jgi:response regulator RpfG family c-di-GMP phosphodiesterase
MARDIAATHHEKYDGSGYPNGLIGENIPLCGRIIALSDVYDALISKRVYKQALTHESAKAIILEGRCKHFDPDVVDCFIDLEDQFIAIHNRFSEGNF